MQVHWFESDVRSDNAAVGENVADQAVHAFGGGNDAANVIFALGAEVSVVLLVEESGEALHAAERRPHIMSNAVGPAFQFGDSFLKFRCSLPDEIFEMDR